MDTIFRDAAGVTRLSKASSDPAGTAIKNTEGDIMSPSRRLTFA